MVRRAVIREAFDRGSCKLSHEGYQGIISESRKTWVKYPDEERMLLDQILSLFFVPSLPSSYLLDLEFLLSWLFLCVWRSVTPFQTVERLCSFSVLSYYKIRVFDECIVSERQLFDDVLSVHKELTSLCIQNWTWYLHSFSSLPYSRKCTTIDGALQYRALHQKTKKDSLYHPHPFLSPYSLLHQLMLILLSKYPLSPPTSLFPLLPQ